MKPKPGTDAEYERLIQEKTDIMDNLASILKRTQRKSTGKLATGVQIKISIKLKSLPAQKYRRLGNLRVKRKGLNVTICHRY